MMKTIRSLVAMSLFLFSLSAIGQAPNAQLSIFPQPASTQISLAFDNDQINNVHVMVYDLLGNMVAEIVPVRDEKGTYSMYVGDRKPGYYFLKIVADDYSYSRRITIKP